jgi:hypothetical protein
MEFGLILELYWLINVVSTTCTCTRVQCHVQHPEIVQIPNFIPTLTVAKTRLAFSTENTALWPWHFGCIQPLIALADTWGSSLEAEHLDFLTHWHRWIWLHQSDWHRIMRISTMSCLWFMTPLWYYHRQWLVFIPHWSTLLCLHAVEVCGGNDWSSYPIDPPYSRCLHAVEAMTGLHTPLIHPIACIVPACCGGNDWSSYPTDPPYSACMLWRQWLVFIPHWSTLYIVPACCGGNDWSSYPTDPPYSACRLWRYYRGFSEC